MKKIFLFFFLAFTQKFCFSQNRIMDSLKTELQNAKHDTTRLRLFLALGGSCERKNNMLYAEPAVELADKLLSQNIDEKQRKIILEQKSSAYNLIIAYYTKSNNIDWNKVIEFIQERLAGYEKEGNKKRIGEAIFAIANMYFYKNDTAGFLEYTKKGLAVFFEIKDTVFIVNGYRELTQYYLARGNFQQALKSIQSAIEISKEMNYKKGEALTLAQLGDIYRDNGENAQALTPPA